MNEKCNDDAEPHLDLEGSRSIASVGYPALFPTIALAELKFAAARRNLRRKRDTR